MGVNGTYDRGLEMLRMRRLLVLLALGLCGVAQRRGDVVTTSLIIGIPTLTM